MPRKQKSTQFDRFRSLRDSGALGSGGFTQGSTFDLSTRFSPTSAPAEKVTTTEPLTSRNFANLMESLDQAGAHELKYLKLSEYLQKTGNLLDIEMSKLPLGYSDKAECGVDRVNFPVMGAIFDSVGKQEVQEYIQQLSSLPALTKDNDYQAAAAVALRSVAARERIQQAYPGFTEAWQDFFGDLMLPGFQSLPMLADSDDRRVLFEAISSIIQGRVTTPELRPHQALIEQASETFRTGTTEQFGDMLYAISSVLVDTPPPEPPSDPDEGDNGEPDADSPPSEDSDGADAENPDPGESGKDGQGQSGNGGQEPDQDPTQDQDKGQEKDQDKEPDKDPDKDSDDQDGDGEGEKDSESESEAEQDDEKDPFSKLAQFMRNADPKNMPEPKNLDVDKQFQPDEVEFDTNGIQELLELSADVTIPDTAPGLHSVFYRTPVPPGAASVWNLLRSTYHGQVSEMVRLIDEFYRTKTINERGLLTGRADGSRLYKVAFGSREVFKRSYVDSVGHMKMIVLLDESGSMASGVDDFKLPDQNMLDQFSQYFSDATFEYFQGQKIPSLDCDRSTLARLMGFLMLEASKSLDGFDVEVAGYTGASREVLPTRVQPLYEAVIKMIKDTGSKPGYGAPTVRLLGDKRSPLGALCSGPDVDNADIQALAWAIERLEKEHSDQKCIVFAADGCVYDSQNIMPKLLERARRANIYIHFMDMSEGSIPDDSPLNKLPKTEVNSFKGMMNGLTDVLQAVTRNYL